MTRPTFARLGEAGTEFVLPAARLRDLVGSGGGGGVAIGSIVVNAAPGQDAKAVANETVGLIERRIANSRRTRRVIGGAGRGGLFS